MPNQWCSAISRRCLCCEISPVCSIAKGIRVVCARGHCVGRDAFRTLDHALRRCQHVLCSVMRQNADTKKPHTVSGVGLGRRWLLEVSCDHATGQPTECS
jgi:hypothetical protein